MFRRIGAKYGTMRRVGHLQVNRQTVDLSAYPDLVVIYLGMRVNRPRGLMRLIGLGPQIDQSWRAPRTDFFCTRT